MVGGSIEEIEDQAKGGNASKKNLHENFLTTAYRRHPITMCKSRNRKDQYKLQLV